MNPRRATSFGLGLAVLLLGIAGAIAFAAPKSTAVLHVPGTAHVAGANSTVWRTDLELRSVSPTAATVRIDLLRRGRDNTTHPSTTVELQAGSAHRFEDTLDTLFGFEGSATLRLTTLTGTIRAASRTFNQGPDGTYGQYIGAATDDDVFDLGRDATLIQLTSSPVTDTGFRTNIGLVNLEAETIAIQIDLFEADVTYLGRVTTTLQAFEYDQIDRVFHQVTDQVIADGFAIVRATSANSRFLTYASVIDNLTGDPIYIPGLVNSGDDITPTVTPTPTAGGPSPTATPTTTPTPTIPVSGVTVTTLDGASYDLVPASIRFKVGSGVQTSLVLCSFDGTLSQVSSSSFAFIRGPTETVGWANCCANFGAKLEYETFIGLGGPAVARSTCTAGTPFFAITGDEIGTGARIEVNGEDLDIAVWP
jgi:hypothetical protein